MLLLPFRRVNLNLQAIEEAWKQLLPVADLPDALLFGLCIDDLPALAEAELSQRIRLLQRLAMLLHQHLPGRPDLLYQVLMREATGSLLKSAPKAMAQARPVVFPA